MIERYCPSAPIEGPDDFINAARGRGIVDLPLGNTIVTVQCTKDIIDVRARDTEEGFIHPVHMVATTNRSPEQFELPLNSRVLHLALGTQLRHTLSEEARPGFQAGKFVEAAITELESKGSAINYCEARWISGTNLDAFAEARMQGATLVEAAASTWTARQLAQNGFAPLPCDIRTVKRRTDYSSGMAVYALFRRLDQSVS